MESVIGGFFPEVIKNDDKRLPPEVASLLRAFAVALYRQFNYPVRYFGTQGDFDIPDHACPNDPDSDKG